MELLLLEPVFKQMIWGGSRLKDDFGYDIPATGFAVNVDAVANVRMKDRPVVLKPADENGEIFSCTFR